MEKNSILREYSLTDDTFQKIILINTNFKKIFNIDIIPDLIVSLNGKRIYLADKLYNIIAEKLNQFFIDTFGSDFKLGGLLSGGKIFYNFWLFMDGDWVLKNQIKDISNNIIIKEKTLLYMIVYQSDALKANIENMKKQIKG
jgi:hypothetical protein